MQTNVKVLIKQTRNQNTMASVRDKGLMHCSVLCSLYKTLSGYCTSTSSQVRVTLSSGPKSRVFIHKFSCLFYCGDNVHKMCTLSTKCVQRPQNLYNVHKTCTTSTTNDFWFVLSNSILRHFTESHLALHMIDFNCMQCFYDISRAYIFLF